MLKSALFGLSSWVVLGMATSLCQAAITPVAPGLKTLSAAISAATAGDTLVLSTGTYDEGVVSINKNLTIEAGSGQSPLVYISLANLAPNNGAFLLQFNTALVTWDGIDVTLDAKDPSLTDRFRGVLIESGPVGSPNVAIIKNCTIKDGAAGTIIETLNNNFALLAKNRCRMELENVVVDFRNSKLTAGIVSYTNGADSSEVIMTNCDVTLANVEGDGAIFSFGGDGFSKITATNTDFRSVGVGVNWFIVSALNGDFELTDCTVTMDDNVRDRGIMMRGAAGPNVGSFVANRSLFDFSGQGAAAANCRDFSIESSGATIDLTNCAILYKGSQANGSPWVNENGGNLLLKHTTISDVSPADGTAPVRMTNLGAASTPGQVTVQNCLLNVGGAVPSAYISTVGTADSQVTFTIGSNFISGTAANVGDAGSDKVGTGTVVAGNGATTLQGDGYHLVFGANPAVDTAPNIGITDDIDNQVRPDGGGFDFGADEGIQPAQANRWNLY